MVVLVVDWAQGCDVNWAHRQGYLQVATRSAGSAAHVSWEGRAAVVAMVAVTMAVVASASAVMAAAMAVAKSSAAAVVVIAQAEAQAIVVIALARQLL